MAQLFLPTLHTFAMNNIFTGSSGLFRFRVQPHVVMAPRKRWIFKTATCLLSTGTAFSAMRKAIWREAKPFP